ncbi:sulfite exporter TauE/SafE family protein [Streptomyces sp. NBC_00846]|uniref:sulfite exporter TauE/SafE family protein n=1 Tax=Streptomyces sp. NBC_00846 TaxID=2975849 RepID=UPI003866DFC5|nr:sulfite exporter TauE/SafE family protein [Streptomyces sp. NBC_00846]
MSVLILALLCGAVVGLAIGALGGGGGVLAVPALVYLLGVAPADAGTTSLVVVTVTSVTALARHVGTGNIRWRTGALFAAAGVAPAIGASMCAHRIPQAVLTTAFAVLAALAAAVMLRGLRAAHGSRQAAASETAASQDTAPGSAVGAVASRSGRPGPADATAVGAALRTAGGTSAAAQRAGAPAPEEAGGADTADGHGRSVGRAGYLRTTAAGAGLGAVTGLLGVGGGFLAVPALVSVLRLPMRQAVGTSLVVILINSVASLATRLAAGGMSLDLAIFGPFVGAAILGAWDGKRLAAKLSGAALQRTFAALLLAMAVFMLIDVFV